MIAASPVQAASLDFDIVSNQFSKPSMHFDYKDGKFVWDRKPITTAFRASGSIDRGYRWDPQVTLAPERQGREGAFRHHALRRAASARRYHHLSCFLPVGLHGSVRQLLRAQRRT
jgi:hypothetical protein